MQWHIVIETLYSAGYPASSFKKFIEEFQDRLFYGTDICDPRNITNPMLRLASWLDKSMESGRISCAAYQKVSRDNARHLLDGI